MVSKIFATYSVRFEMIADMWKIGRKIVSNLSNIFDNFGVWKGRCTTNQNRKQIVTRNNSVNFQRKNFHERFVYCLFIVFFFASLVIAMFFWCQALPMNALWCCLKNISRKHAENNTYDFYNKAIFCFYKISAERKPTRFV